MERVKSMDRIYTTYGASLERKLGNGKGYEAIIMGLKSVPPYQDAKYVMFTLRVIIERLVHQNQEEADAV